jgi:hypothetical protein
MRAKSINVLLACRVYSLKTRNTCAVHAQVLFSRAARGDSSFCPWPESHVSSFAGEVRCSLVEGFCLDKFSLDYKGLQPGMAAQPIGPNK